MTVARPSPLLIRSSWFNRQPFPSPRDTLETVLPPSVKAKTNRRRRLKIAVFAVNLAALRAAMTSTVQVPWMVGETNWGNKRRGRSYKKR